MNRTIILLAGLLLTVTACGGAEQGRDKEGTVYRTVVQFRPDGSSDVKIYQVDRAQQQAEVAMREQRVRHGASGEAIGTLSQAISADPTCDGADLWLFDDVNQTGTNELCLFGEGVAELWNYQTQYCDLDGCFFSTWAGHVRSYWAGVSPRHLHEFWFSWDQHFGAWERTDVAGWTASHAQYVVLDF